MKILVFNAGSTSIKFKLFNFSSGKPKLEKQGQEKNTNNYDDIFKKILRQIGDLREIEALGHRVVHGGKNFKSLTRIKAAELKALEKLIPLAPLHNPSNLGVIKIAQKYLPNLPNYAYFDTAFFSHLPQYAKTYALPQELNKKYGIERFGFQGISHEYATEESARRIKKSKKECNIITVHLGGGSSLAAVENGQAIDTTMGMTPLGGIPMLTRPGDLDPGIIIKLLEDYSAKELDELLNHQSGVKGISGEDDYLKFLKRVEKGEKKASLAFEIFTYSIQKTIGAYFAALGGRVDALAFTGQVGAGRALTRKTIINKIKPLLKETKFLYFTTDEEKIIAEKVYSFLKSK